MNAITYETIHRVRLNGKLVGEIREVDENETPDGSPRFQYFPYKSTGGLSENGGDKYPTLMDCLRSLGSFRLNV